MRNLKENLFLYFFVTNWETQNFYKHPFWWTKTFVFISFCLDLLNGEQVRSIVFHQLFKAIYDFTESGSGIRICGQHVLKQWMEIFDHVFRWLQAKRVNNLSNTSWCFCFKGKKWGWRIFKEPKEMIRLPTAVKFG